MFLFSKGFQPQNVPILFLFHKKHSYQFMISLVALKDFNFLSKYAIFSYSHSSNASIVSLISL